MQEYWVGTCIFTCIVNYESIELCRGIDKKNRAISTEPQNEDYKYFRIADEIIDVVDSLPKLKFENK